MPDTLVSHERARELLTRAAHDPSLADADVLTLATLLGLNGKGGVRKAIHASQTSPDVEGVICYRHPARPRAILVPSVVPADVAGLLDDLQHAVDSMTERAANIRSDTSIQLEKVADIFARWGLEHHSRVVYRWAVDIEVYGHASERTTSELRELIGVPVDV